MLDISQVFGVNRRAHHRQMADRADDDDGTRWHCEPLHYPQKGFWKVLERCVLNLNNLKAIPFPLGRNQRRKVLIWLHKAWRCLLCAITSGGFPAEDTVFPFVSASFACQCAYVKSAADVPVSIRIYRCVSIHTVILLSCSLSNPPIGTKGIAEPSGRTAKDKSLENLTAQ